MSSGLGSGDFQPFPRHIREPVTLALAGIIHEQRIQRGWSLNQFAARSHLSRQMLSFIESHQRVATTETLQRIAVALGMKSSALIRSAERRALRWPVKCRGCNYSCVERGLLKWWNPRRGCVRPKH
jgi:transcriptional regulator with XRE-family HTH domain